MRFFLLVVLCCGFAWGQFEKSEVMIPARDGVKLHTVIFTPKDAAKPLPVMFLRTPYGATSDASSVAASYKELIEDGYIFAFQDIRGRFKSEGSFVMQRPVRDKSVAGSVDESTDAFDSIEWMLKNVKGNNGRFGMFGVSYPGWLVTMALLEPHPALKAVSEQATPADMFLGDDFHHNGAFRLSYGFEYAAMMESAKDANTNFAFDRADTYQWYLKLGVLANVNERYLKGKIPTWNDFVAHPDYDPFWQKLAFWPYIKAATTVPNLNVAGFWDQEDFYGPVKVYDLFERFDSKRLNHLVIGPWNHGGWRRQDGSKLGDIAFDSNTSKYFKARIEAPWFAYWLHDKGTRDFAEATIFQTGTNRWMRYDAWPPREAVARPMYLREGGGLSFDAPAGDGFDSYLSDPAHPVPYRKRPISPTYPGGGWPAWLTEDQRFVDSRPDVASWQSDVLTEDVKIAGKITARIFASTSGTDADWVVKLIDVYPESYPEQPGLAGHQLMIANEILRGRYRESFEKPKAIPAGEVVAYTIDLHTANHAFLKGHRIMVQIQSSWFPLYDRNPQTFVPNIFLARPEDYKAATQRIYRAKGSASSVVLPVVK